MSNGRKEIPSKEKRRGRKTRYLFGHDQLQESSYNPSCRKSIAKDPPVATIDKKNMQGLPATVDLSWLEERVLIDLPLSLTLMFVLT